MLVSNNTFQLPLEDTNRVCRGIRTHTLGQAYPQQALRRHLLRQGSLRWYPLFRV
jgi:hypothetical protein